MVIVSDGLRMMLTLCWLQEVHLLQLFHINDESWVSSSCRTTHELLKKLMSGPHDDDLELAKEAKGGKVGWIYVLRCEEKSAEYGILCSL
jgi:hypothetical protein